MGRLVLVGDEPGTGGGCQVPRFSVGTSLSSAVVVVAAVAAVVVAAAVLAVVDDVLAVAAAVAVASFRVCDGVRSLGWIDAEGETFDLCHWKDHEAVRQM